MFNIFADFSYVDIL